jgi:hypothetical protein
MIRFNYFKERGAFTRNEDGIYRAEFDEMRAAIDSLSELILRLQGDGDYAAAGELVDGMSRVDAELEADLERLTLAGIPTDIVFRQGAQLLGLD